MRTGREGFCGVPPQRSSRGKERFVVTPTAHHGCALSHCRAQAAREPSPGCPSASSHCGSRTGSRSLCHPENQKSQRDGHQQPRAECCTLPSVAAGWFPEPRPGLEQPKPSTHHFTTKTPTSEVRALSFGSPRRHDHCKEQGNAVVLLPDMKSSSGKTGSKPFKARSPHRPSAQLLFVKVWLAERKATLKIMPQHSRLSCL